MRDARPRKEKNPVRLRSEVGASWRHDECKVCVCARGPTESSFTGSTEISHITEQLWMEPTSENQSGAGNVRPTSWQTETTSGVRCVSLLMFLARVKLVSQHEGSNAFPSAAWQWMRKWIGWFGSFLPYGVIVLSSLQCWLGDKKGILPIKPVPLVQTVLSRNKCQNNLGYPTSPSVFFLENWRRSLIPKVRPQNRRVGGEMVKFKRTFWKLQWSIHVVSKWPLVSSPYR